jgi:hypothetical protein
MAARREDALPEILEMGTSLRGLASNAFRGGFTGFLIATPAST